MTTRALNRPRTESNAAAPPADRLYIFFAFAYIAQGMSSQFGLIAQPTQFFLMKSLALTAADISLFTAVMMLPWILKPLYGLLSDTIPFFGYRRKSYLVAAHVLAVVGLACLWKAGAPHLVFIGLICIAFAMAVATALMLGLAAQTGRENGKTGQYVSAQSFYYYLGNIGAVLLGGVLCQSFLPPAALQTAAGLAILPVIILTFLSVRMIDEPKHAFSKDVAKQGWQSIKEAIRDPRLRVIGMFAFLWNFTPSFGVPLYFHESNNLLFEQSLIGQLTAWNALGMMAGAVIYRDLVKRLNVQSRLFLVIGLWAASIFSYTLLSTAISGYFIEIFRGCCNTIEILCLYELAACCCNAQNSVSVMAFLLAARNIGNEFGTLVGGSLFTYVFHNQYFPLVLVGIISPLLSMSLIPHMVRNQKEQAS